jgi:hypothetical protein
MEENSRSAKHPGSYAGRGRRKTRGEGFVVRSETCRDCVTIAIGDCEARLKVSKSVTKKQESGLADCDADRSLYRVKMRSADRI